MTCTCKIKLTFPDNTIKLSSGSGLYPIVLRIKDYQRVVVYGDADPYEGAYEVTPKVSEQTLETKKKILLDDIKVKGVPAYETSNFAGGTTFYIAKE